MSSLVIVTDEDHVRTVRMNRPDKRNALTLSMYEAMAEAIALGEKAGLEKGQLLDVLNQTAVLTPGQKSKLDNVRREQYPTNFALSLMHKDFSLVLSQAYDVSVSMPATAAAQQMYTAAMAKGMDADFSIMIQFMEELAGLSTRSEEQRGN